MENEKQVARLGFFAFLLAFILVRIVVFLIIRGAFWICFSLFLHQNQSGPFKFQCAMGSRAIPEIQVN